MSYANYQWVALSFSSDTLPTHCCRGKEALVEKFKNSCIMDEREAWRPKIFYSEPGPEQGLSEPFPAPTHLRRKERSSFNRGALYVPGVGRGSPTSQVAASSSIRRHVQGEQRPRHVSADAEMDELGHPLGSRRRPNKLWVAS